MDLANLKKLSGLSQEDLRKRQKDFRRQFPSEQVSQGEFKKLALQIVDANEVDSFARNVFKLFDRNHDGKLNFEEFTLALSAKEDMGKKIEEKLEWIFDHVYDKDKSGDVSPEELCEILKIMLEMESVPEAMIQEMVKDIFKEIDTNADGHISKHEFIQAANSCEHLSKILTSAADIKVKRAREDQKMNKKGRKNTFKRTK